MKIEVKNGVSGEWSTVLIKKTSLLPSARWITRTLIEHLNGLNDDMDIEYYYDNEEDRNLTVKVTMNNDVVMIMHPFYGLSKNMIPDHEIDLWREYKKLDE